MNPCGVGRPGQFRVMADELITISRDGNETGKYLESDLMMLIEQKKVLPTDHYWKEVMTSWGLISQFIAMRKEAARQVKAAADAEAARLKKEAADQEKAKKAAENPVWKEIVESQRAFAARTVSWDMDTNISRRMAYNHYFGKKAPAKKG